jgi:hypothetical protein
MSQSSGPESPYLLRGVPVVFEELQKEIDFAVFKYGGENQKKVQETVAQLRALLQQSGYGISKEPSKPPPLSRKPTFAEEDFIIIPSLVLVLGNDRKTITFRGKLTTEYLFRWFRQAFHGRVGTSGTFQKLNQETDEFEDLNDFRVLGEGSVIRLISRGNRPTLMQRHLTKLG